MEYWHRMAGSFFTVLGVLLMLNVAAPAMLSVEPGGIDVLYDPVAFFNLLVGPGEELLFRFTLPVGLMVLLGIGYLPAAMISSVIFGLLHGPRSAWDWGIIGFTAAAGALISIIVYLFGREEDRIDFRGTLLGAALGHSFYDLLVFVASDLAKLVLAVTFLALGYMSWRRLRGFD